ncbi:MAG TPA: ComEC/Rec2 family competence protein, partial [Arthrobacter sp.]
MDVRLVPSALLVWAAAATGDYLHPAPLAALCLALVAAATGLLLLRGPPGVEPGGAARGGPDGRGGGVPGGRGGGAGGATRRFTGRTRRNFPATLAVALLLSAAAGGHAAVDTSRRHDGAVAGYVAAQADVAAEVEITSAPRRLRTVGRAGLADRWAVPANLIEMQVDGHRVRAQATLLVMGGAGWDRAAPGQRLRTTGKLSAPEPGQAEAAVLSASSAPLRLSVAGPSQAGPAELRQHFTAAAKRLDGDARGLLPGMVTGDTSSVDTGLDAAMKTVGMTHLTA